MTEDTIQKLSLDQLEFREIFAGTHAHLARILAEKEKVHSVTEQELLETRLASGPDSKESIHRKHCYGLFVPGEEEPEVVVYVRLMRKKEDEKHIVRNSDLSGNIHMILDEKSEPLDKDWSPPNLAIFYTISLMTTDATKFAKGKVSGPGEELLHRVAEHLEEKYDIHTLTTLSPMRGFAKWLKNAFVQESDRPVLTRSENEQLNIIKTKLPKKPNSFDAISYLHHNPDIMSSNEKSFFANMMRDLGCYYLVHEKSSKPRPDGSVQTQTRDDVANFHLKNGAELANIHYRIASDTTKRENAEAFGLMANYHYEQAFLNVRKSAYVLSGKVKMDARLKIKFTKRSVELNPANTDIATLDSMVYVPPEQITKDNTNKTIGKYS